MPFCYDVTIKSTETLGSFNGSAEKGRDPKNVLLGCILHQSIHYSITGFEATEVHFPEGGLKLMARVTY